MNKISLRDLASAYRVAVEAYEASAEIGFNELPSSQPSFNMHDDHWPVPSGSPKGQPTGMAVIYILITFILWCMSR